MKRYTYLPLLCTLFAGCSAPATQPGNAAPTTETAADAAPAATTAVAAAPTEAPKTYKVKNADDIDLGQGAPPELAEKYRAAMKKVALKPPPLDTPLAEKVRLTIDTNRGPITVELDSKAAPLQVRSFVYLAGKGFFDQTKFHRYADLLGNGKGYIIQGGDPMTKSPSTANFAGMGGPGYEVPREFNNLKHEKLVIAAARSQDPDSAGSQFYITQAPVEFLDQGDGYTVFGKVVEGQSAAMKLRQNDVIKSVKLDK
jgi:cyclophilin family peptidyl-prolyl cis-trans isomerase